MIRKLGLFSIEGAQLITQRGMRWPRHIHILAGAKATLYRSRPTEARKELSKLLPSFSHFTFTLRDRHLPWCYRPVFQPSQTIFKVTVNPSAIRMREPQAPTHMLSIATFRLLRFTEPR
jgi:hypothetical protein